MKRESELPTPPAHDFALDDYDTLRTTLEKVRSTGDHSFRACCPAHEDKSPSLSVTYLGCNDLRIHCFVGCTFQSIHEAAGTWRGGRVESWSKRSTRQEAKELTAEQQDEDANRILDREKRQRDRDIGKQAALAVSEAVTGRTIDNEPVIVGAYSARCSESVISRMLGVIGIEHRHNLRADHMEYRQTGDVLWGERNDRATAYWRQTLIPAHCLVTRQDGKETKDVPLRFNKTELHDALDGHAHSRSVDPFIEWLEARPAWDSVSRLDRVLVACFPSAAACGPLAEWAGRSVLLACILRAYRPGEKHDETVVLQGREQGPGKSTYFAWLFPPEHRQHWFTDCFDFQRSRKELVEALQARVIVEASDMAGADRADVERVKKFLTSVNDGSVRLAYRRDPESRPRRCVIVGTSNSGDMLPNDPTGLRRWVVIPTTEVDKAHVQHVRQYLDTDRDQLWAEALHRFRAGEPARLPDDLKDDQKIVNGPRGVPLGGRNRRSVRE